MKALLLIFILILHSYADENGKEYTKVYEELRRIEKSLIFEEIPVYLIYDSLHGYLEQDSC